jgi:hypothetical protein
LLKSYESDKFPRERGARCTPLENLKEEKNMAKAREPLIVASKLKNYIRSKNLKCASDVIPALSERVYKMLDCAMERTRANKRSTLRPQDL